DVPTIFVAVGTLPPSLVELPADLVALPTLRIRACIRILAARFRPSYHKFVASPSNKRAQGMPGARCTRGLVCQKCALWRTRAYRAAETLRHPLRNGFTAYIALSPVERACCHRHP